MRMYNKKKCLETVRKMIVWLVLILEKRIHNKGKRSGVREIFSQQPSWDSGITSEY